MRKFMFAAFVAAAAIAPAAAQTQNGLVNVDVTNVLNDLDVDLLNNSLNNNTVQVPVGIAANVCGVTANVLAAQKKGGDATCTATSVSSALKDAAKKQAVSKTAAQ